MSRSHPFKLKFWSRRRAVVLLFFLAAGYPYQFGSDPASAAGEMTGLFILAWVAIVLFNRGRELVGGLRRSPGEAG